MTTYVANGTGRLYEAEGKESIAMIAYRIYRNPATEQRDEEWWGGFALEYAIAEPGEYTLELEDGRKGICLVEMRKAQELPGSLTFYHYSLKGIGVLK